MSNDGELKLEIEDFGKSVYANADTITADLWNHTRVHLDCKEIELNTNNAKIVLASDKLTRELETCDYIEINGFVFRKEEK